jgi:hypothetical protein
MGYCPCFGRNQSWQAEWDSEKRIWNGTESCYLWVSFPKWCRCCPNCG